MKSATGSKTRLSLEELDILEIKVRSYLKANSRITNSTLRRATGIGYDQAIYAFAVLIKRNTLRRMGKGSGTHYIILER
jgi:predicted HTH transcriptional regulator